MATLPSRRITIPRKHFFTVLYDTARLLDDLAKLHPTPEYVHGYANDVRRAAKEIQKQQRTAYRQAHAEQETR